MQHVLTVIVDDCHTSFSIISHTSCWNSVRDSHRKFFVWFISQQVIDDGYIETQCLCSFITWHENQQNSSRGIIQISCTSKYIIIILEGFVNFPQAICSNFSCGFNKFSMSRIKDMTLSMNICLAINFTSLKGAL